MSAISYGRIGPPAARVLRTRRAIVAAARTLFLRDGYGGTTMEDIAAEAGVAKRTVHYHYPDKEALFNEIVLAVITFAEGFARALREEFVGGVAPNALRDTLHNLGRRHSLAIVRPEVIALRRLVVAESRTLPALAREYYDRVPGQVIESLAVGLGHLLSAGLRVPKRRRAAAQFAYLVAGELLDRAMLTGQVPSEREIVECAREGVETFLARYARITEAGNSTVP
jgi:TetR/AcrR family transcriptional regulator, mexJK operon transcriptional repressor